MSILFVLLFIHVHAACTCTLYIQYMYMYIAHIHFVHIHVHVHCSNTSKGDTSLKEIHLPVFETCITLSNETFLHVQCILYCCTNYTQTKKKKKKDTLRMILISHFCSTALVFLRSSCNAFLTPGRSFLRLDRAKSSRYWFTWAIVRLHVCKRVEQSSDTCTICTALLVQTNQIQLLRTCNMYMYIHVHNMHVHVHVHTHSVLEFTCLSGLVAFPCIALIPGFVPSLLSCLGVLVVRAPAM